MSTTGTVYGGLDNGVSGACVFLHPNGFITAHLNPTIEIGGDLVIDDVKLRDLIHSARGDAQRIHVVFERGQKQPLFGCKTNFSQGDSNGVVRTVLRQNGIPATGVNPKEWQKEMHAGFRPKGCDTKTASIAACKALFPNFSLIAPRCRVDHDGIADALLMAAFGRKHNF